MKYATLRLSDKNDHNKYYDLKFRLNNNNFVRKWIGCVLEAQQKQCPISEPWAIYNLNNSLNGEFIKNKLYGEVKKDQVPKSNTKYFNFPQEIIFAHLISYRLKVSPMQNLIDLVPISNDENS